MTDVGVSARKPIVSTRGPCLLEEERTRIDGEKVLFLLLIDVPDPGKEQPRDRVLFGEEFQWVVSF